MTMARRVTLTATSTAPADTLRLLFRAACGARQYKLDKGHNAECTARTMRRIDTILDTWLEIEAEDQRSARR